MRQQAEGRDERASRRFKISISVATAVLAICALTAPSAGAVDTHAFKEVFGSAAHPDVSEPSAMAIDHSTGDLYVTDMSYVPGVRVQHLARYKANGEPQPFSALGTNEIDGDKGPGGKPCAEEPASCDALPEGGFSTGEIQSLGRSTETQIAIDESGTLTDGNIYLTQPGAKQIDIFAGDGHFLGQLRKAGAKNLGEICGVAAAPNGSVFVGSYSNNTVYRYGSVGAFPTNGDGSPFSTAIARPCSLAVGKGSSAGSIFVNRYKGAVYELDFTTGALKSVVAEGPAPAPNSGLVTITVDPATGHLFAGYETELNEYDVGSGPGASLLSTVKAKRTLSGIAVDGTIFMGLIPTPEGPAEEVPPIRVYAAPIVSAPQVSTGAASAIASTRATLNGTVNPEGSSITECYFEYGTTTAPYEHTVPCAESEAEIGSGTASVAVKADVTGLAVGGEVNFRLVVKNSGDFQVEGANASFETAPIAATLSATAISETTATLNGIISPDGSAVTECYFEYGTTTAPYEHTVPCAESEAEIGSGTALVAVHASIAGLTPKGTAYHFRLVAKGVNGTGTGFDFSFSTTLPIPVVTGSASAVGPASATLNGTVNPEGSTVGACFFEYGTTATSYQHSVPCAESAAAIGTGSNPAPVHADISGLNPGFTYHFRLVAEVLGASSSGEDASFRVAGPSIEAEWATNVSRTEAELKAEINPRGSATSFFVEYGTTETYGQSTSLSTSIGSGSTARVVDTALEGFAPGVMYHFRFVAVSHCNPGEPAEECVAVGPDRSLVTYSPTLAPRSDCPNQAFRSGPSASLPNCRAYEMVSPVDKEGSDVEVSFTINRNRDARLNQAANDGERVTFSAYRAFADPSSSPYTSQYMSVRRDGEGWVTRNISPPQEGPDELEIGALDTQYKGFSEDLCSGWILKGTEPLLAPEAVPDFANLYRRDNCGSGGYEALSKGNPIGIEHGANDNFFVPALKGFSADGTRAFFSARGKLAPDANSDAQQLYENVDGSLKFVCYLPSGAPFTEDCTAGSGMGNTQMYFRDFSVRDAVSGDGSRVYWTGGTSLYLRIHPEQEPTVSGECEASEPEKACTLLVKSELGIYFWDAATDGSRAIYTTGDIGGAGADLFEFDATGESASSTHLAGEVYGVMGASDDAERVYFASKEVLTAGTNEEGEAPVAGRPNLYLHEVDGGGGPGRFVYIAALPPEDLTRPSETISTRPIDASPFYRSARVSPSGLHAAFVSSGSLTGYDNTDQNSGAEDLEVFLYDGPTDGADSGQLRCASCNPSGARPVGRDVNIGEASGKAPDWMAAHIPGWETSLHPSRVLSADGSRLFFESFEALVPRDTNGSRDVYQWERGESQAQCEALGAELFLIREGGCLSLISSGENRADSIFVDASTDGRDVYFTTSAGLVPQDPGLSDIYDARDGGGFAGPTGPPAPCEGEACQGPLSPPNDPTPASLTFRGAGNVAEKGRKQCPKGKIRRKGKCVPKKHQRKGHKKQKRASRNSGGQK